MSANIEDTPALYDCRDAFADVLTELGEADERIVAVVNDSVGSSKLGGFATRFPERIINVGIAEQNQVGVAAGLEGGGRLPIVSCAGSFLSARAMEQVKIDAAYSYRHMVLTAQSPGLAYGQLGSTHHSAEDVAWMRVIPNMTVIVPADPVETAAAVRWAVTAHDGPVYIRISRMKVPAVHADDYVFAPGRATTLRDGDDLTIITNGTVLHRAVAAADALAAEGIHARVLSMACVKPLDEDAVLSAARETGRIITAEEGLVAGGLGGAVTELVTDNQPVPVKRIGIPDTFAPTGSEGWLMDHWGISADGITAAAKELLG
ncbi:MAG: transketolase family protein [Actinomyces ruminicola]|uniref:Transketolase n=1 Tax=Actinomyces ruminicola TaxID=332524 RepID=A0A1G9ZM77_9ACTO|nr:transketolase C-terminal domain-containing protein [Actinomyces ruminicola]MBE6481915.1 transketolase family protein [Actinomyces ruminicola]SDN21736.1 transketolase [Actinomyces ruminicola]